MSLSFNGITVMNHLARLRCDSPIASLGGTFHVTGAMCVSTPDQAGRIFHPTLALLLTLVAVGSATAAQETREEAVAGGPSTGITSTLELGARWNRIEGNEGAYRSQVNLASGPRLLRSSVKLGAPESRRFCSVLCSSLAFDLGNVGDDIDRTSQVSVEKARWYTFAYRHQTNDLLNYVPVRVAPTFDRALAAEFGRQPWSSGMNARTTTTQLSVLPETARVHLRFGHYVHRQDGPAFFAEDSASGAFLLNELATRGAEGTVRVKVAPRLSVTGTSRIARVGVRGRTVLADLSADRVEASYYTSLLNSFMQEVMGEYAVTHNVSVRGGMECHRRHAVYGRDDGRANEVTTLERGCNTLLGGSYQWRGLAIEADYAQPGYPSEFARVGREGERRHVSVEARPTPTLAVRAFGVFSDETGPSRLLDGISRVFSDRDRNRAVGFSVTWADARRLSAGIEYVRSYVTAQVHTLEPDAAAPIQPLLVFHATNDSLAAGVVIEPFKDAVVELGHHLDSSTGMLPLRSHRPYARVSWPLNDGAALNLSYQRHGYREPGHPLQAYGANLLTVSVRMTFTPEGARAAADATHPRHGC